MPEWPTSQRCSDARREERSASDIRSCIASERRAASTNSRFEILTGMIQEYARHLGRADLLRERIDGRIGQ